MIRFIMKVRELDNVSNLEAARFYTIDGSAEELEKALSAGGKGEGCYEVHELVGVEVVNDDTWKVVEL